MGKKATNRKSKENVESLRKSRIAVNKQILTHVMGMKSEVDPEIEFKIRENNQMGNVKAFNYY